VVTLWSGPHSGALPPPALDVTSPARGVGLSSSQTTHEVVVDDSTWSFTGVAD